MAEEPNKVRITERDAKKWHCSYPRLEVLRKDCGCMSSSRCRNCGREDIFPMSHHMPSCRNSR